MNIDKSYFKGMPSRQYTAIKEIYTKIKDKTIDELKFKKEDMFICSDDSLDDSKKKNLSIQCNLKTI